MADIPTFADIFDAGEREILIRPTSFNPEILRVDGSDVNLAIAAAAGMAQEVAQYAQTAFNETHLSTAISTGGETLDRWAYDRYGLTRQESQAAVVSVQFTRTSASLGFTIPSGTVVTSEGGITFAVINDVPFPLGEFGPLEVRAVAQQTGLSGNVAIGTITDVSSGVGEPTLAVNNNEVAAGGSLEETDDEFGQRLKDYHVNARRGTRTAIKAGAINTPGVADATPIEGIDPATGQPNFRVQLVIADSEGQANSALAERVSENLAEYRGLGVPVTVLAGIPDFISIVVEGLAFESSSNTSNVLEEARNAIMGAVNGTAPSSTLRLAVIITALEGVDKLIVPDGVVIEPAGDLIPAIGGVIRTKSEMISLNGA